MFIFIDIFILTNILILIDILMIFLGLHGEAGVKRIKVSKTNVSVILAFIQSIFIIHSEHVLCRIN